VEPSRWTRRALHRRDRNERTSDCGGAGGGDHSDGGAGLRAGPRPSGRGPRRRASRPSPAVRLRGVDLDGRDARHRLATVVRPARARAAGRRRAGSGRVGAAHSAIGQLRAAGTPVPGHRPTTVLVRTGPYRLSRNPIYLAFSLLHLAVAIWVGSWWLLATLVASMTLIVAVVVPREERYLKERFGTTYLAYKASLRRWP